MSGLGYFVIILHVFITHLRVLARFLIPIGLVCINSLSEPIRAVSCRTSHALSKFIFRFILFSFDTLYQRRLVFEDSFGGKADARIAYCCKRYRKVLVFVLPGLFRSDSIVEKQAILPLKKNSSIFVEY